MQAALIANPALQMVMVALAAGKDVYVEKPQCIVPVGMQRRSCDLYRQGRELVASGELDAVRMVRSWQVNNYPGTPAAPAASTGRNIQRYTRIITSNLDWIVACKKTGNWKPFTKRCGAASNCSPAKLS